MVVVLWILCKSSQILAFLICFLGGLGCVFGCGKAEPDDGVLHMVRRRRSYAQGYQQGYQAALPR